MQCGKRGKRRDAAVAVARSAADGAVLAGAERTDAVGAARAVRARRHPQRARGGRRGGGAARLVPVAPEARNSTSQRAFNKVTFACKEINRSQFATASCR